MEIKVTFDPERITGQRDARIYGYFIEHFHNQITVMQIPITSPTGVSAMKIIYLAR